MIHYARHYDQLLNEHISLLYCLTLEGVNAPEIPAANEVAEDK